MTGMIDQGSISARLAASGQLGGPAQPGQRGPLCGLLPGLSYQNPFDPQNCGLFKSSPIPGGLFGLFANGGSFNQKGMGLLQKLAQSLREDFSKANSDASAWIQTMAGGVQQAHHGDVFGHGLPRGMGGGGGHHIDHG